MKALFTAPNFVFLAFALIVLRIILMIQFPVIADEAYYFYWGTHPAGGFYDLPPMVGWWETFLTSFSLRSLWLRLPNLITMALVAFGIREWTKPSIGDASSVWLGLLFFFLPVPFLAVMVAPDLPLLFFTFYSSILFFDAKSKKEYFISGALWGAAFLSKYFALFSLPALLIWHLYLWRKSGKPLKWQGPLWFVLGALPFALQHLIWNATHCWANFVFNLVTRQKVSDGAWRDIVGLFLLYLVLMSTPFLWKWSWRKKSPALQDKNSPHLAHYFLLSWSVPIALFAFTALIGKGQGLHWYIPYLPFFVMWMGLRIVSAESLRRRLFGVMIVSLLLSSVAVISLQDPDRYIKPVLKNRHAFEFELAFRTDDMIERLVPSLNGMEAIALDGYSLASVYDLELKRRMGPAALPVIVMGTGSRFGRVFDFTTPWKELNGKNILMIARGEWSNHDWARFFETTESKWIEQNGIRYWMSKGIGFRYSVYQAEVLSRTYHEFYPSFLGLPSQCELKN